MVLAWQGVIGGFRVESVSIMDLDTLSREELIALLKQATETIVVLQTQVVALQAQVISLQEEIARLKKEPPAPTGRVVPAFVKPNVAKKPTAKRKPRRQSFVCKRRTPTQVVTHAPENCSVCGRKLEGGWLHRVREVLELPVAAVQAIHHHFIARHCGVCNRREIASYDLSEEVVGNSRLGVRLMSTIAYLDTVCRMPVRLIQSLLDSLYGLRLSVGEIDRVLRTVAEKGAGIYTALQEQVRASPAVHADETSWRENGRNGYVWSFSTPSVRWFTDRQGRGGEVARSVLGSAFEGALVTDFYSGYHWYRGEHRYCWVHLLRDLHKLGEQFPQEQQVAAFSAGVKALYERAKTYTHPNRYVRAKQRRQFQQELSALAREHQGAERPERVLAERILKYLWGLFVFVEHPEVPSDNNAAERSIRPLVVVRKVSGGSRSPTGSKTVAVLLSLFGTWQVQGVDVLEACRRMLAGQPALTPA